MSDKKDKAAKVKELALAGRFQDIRSSYGQSSVIKAKEYIMSKVAILTEAIKKDGHIAEGEKCATEFMLFVLKRYQVSNHQDDLFELANIFSSGKQKKTVTKESKINALHENSNPSTPKASAPSSKEITVEKVYEGDEIEYVQCCEIGSDIMDEKIQNENSYRTSAAEKIKMKAESSSFSLFVETTKKVIMRENPSFSKLDVNREVENRWKSLDTTGKDYWIDHAARHRSNFISKDTVNSILPNIIEMEEEQNLIDEVEVNNRIMDDLTKKHVNGSADEENTVSATRDENDKLDKNIIEDSINCESIMPPQNKWKHQISFSQVHSFKPKDTKQQMQFSIDKLQKIHQLKVHSDAEENEEIAELGDIQEIEDSNGDNVDDAEESEFVGYGSDQKELSDDDDSDKNPPKVTKSTSLKIPNKRAVISIPKKSVQQATHEHKISKNLKKSEKVEMKCKKKEKIKDPNAPKRPLNAYVLFAKDHRSGIISDNPTMKISEITKELGIMWNALTFHEKRKYTDAAEELKKKYVVEVNNYRRNLTDDDINKKNNRSMEKQYPKKTNEKDSVLKKLSLNKSNLKKMTISSNIELDINDSPSELSHKIPKTADSVDSNDNDSSDLELEEADKDVNNPEEVASQSMNKVPVRKTSRLAQKRDIINISQIHEDHSFTQHPIRKNNKKMKISEYDDEPVTFVQLKGIKQCHLPPALDLLHMKKVPRLKDKFPDISYDVDSELKLILEPYRLFISSLPCGLLSSSDMENIQRICHFKENVVAIKLTKIDNVKFEIEDESTEKNQDLLKIYTVEFLSEKMSHSSKLKVQKITTKYKILYASPISTLLTTDTFLVSSELYYESMKAPWLHKDAQVRRLLAMETNDNDNSNGNDSDVIGEWQEGSIYYIQRDFDVNPYNSICIVWLQQEESTMDWVFDYMQTDCEASPWDLSLSHFVLLENMKPPSLPKVLKVGTLTAEAILNYFKSQDFSYIFMIKVSEVQEYLDMFPDKKDQLDLTVITSYCSKGRYETDRKGLGIVTLFDDLKRMVKNSKSFNQSNSGFQPYRCADMMEKELLDLAYDLGKCHGIKSLMNFATEAILLSQEECAEETEEV